MDTPHRPRRAPDDPLSEGPPPAGRALDGAGTAKTGTASTDSASTDSATAVLLERLASDPTLEPLPDVDGAGPSLLRRLMRPRWINLALVILLVAAGVGVWVIAKDDASASGATTRTTTVRRGNLTATVSGTGNLTSASSASVGFSTGGTLTSIRVKVGQKVAKGDVLATLDQTDAKAAVVTAKASLATTQAQYDETMAGATTYARQRAKLQLSASSTSVSTAKSALADAKSQYSSDKTTLTAALTQAKRTGNATAIAQAQDKLTQTLAADSKAIDNAEQQLTQARNQYAQQKVGYDETLAGPTTAQKAQARSQLSSAKDAVADAQEALEATVLRAPRDGTVVSLDAEVGDTVSGTGTTSAASSSSGSSASSAGGMGGASSGSTTASSSSSSGVLTLTDLDALEVTASIAEADAQSVKVGQAATVTLSASSSKFEAKVSAVSVVGTTSSNVVTYPVTVTLTETPETVLLGASASVSITTASASDALVVSSSAVTTVGNRHTVTIVKNGVNTVAPVEVGISGDSGTQITSGVSEGDTLLITASTSSSSSSGGMPGGMPGGGFGGGFGGRP